MDGNVFDFIISQCKATFDGEPPPPTIIANARNEITSLSGFSASSPGDVTTWLSRWKSVLSDSTLRESLLVRLLQLHLPRVAEILTLLGIVEFKFQDLPSTQLDSFKIEWTPAAASPSSVMQLLDPAKVKDPLTWLSFLASRLGDDPESAKTNWKLLKTLFGILIASPVELVKLEYQRQGFTSLPRKVNSPPISLDLNNLLGLINSPLRIPLTNGLRGTIPPGSQTPTAYPQLSELLGLFSQPSAGNEILIDGPDTLVGAGLDRLTGLSVSLKVQDPPTFFGAANLPLAGGWNVGIRAHDSGPQTYGIEIAAGGKLKVTGVANPIILELQRSGGSPLIFGANTGSHVTLGRAVFQLTLSGQPGSAPFAVGLALDPVEIVLATSDLSQGLIGVGGALPDLKFNCDFSPVIDSVHGWNSPALGLSFKRTINLGLNLGILQIPDLQLTMGIASASGGIDASLSAQATVSSDLGPVHATLSGVGVKITWASGNAASPLLVEPIFPTGVGLSISAPPLEGGGSIAKLGNKEYGGTFALKLMGIGISAYGIYKELASGDPSFIAILGIRFPPPGVQLSWGFALAGVGGLVGVNRRANTDLLRERLSSGAAGNVLFNDNPAANAPALLNDLRDFFPDAQGVFIVGPTLQITWGVTLVSVDLGVFIELPGPRQIFIAGSLRVMIGVNPEIAVVFLRLDFIGGIDFTTSLIYFDAALVNSHVMQVFRLTGGAALRINYGANGFFLLTIGGFHPSFNPGTLQLPRVARAGAYLSVNVGVSYWLRMEGYFAVTPNTLQLGAKVEAGLGIGPLDAHGWIGFDALIQFNPFHFEARIDAGFDVSCEGVSFCGVQVVGILSGPGPVVISGQASVKILFVRISGSVTITLGSDADNRPQPLDDLLKKVTERLGNAQNFSVRGQGNDPHVILKPSPGLVLISPLGQLIWDQRVIPLGRDLTRFEGVPLTTTSKLSLETVNRKTKPEFNWFSAGTYADMSQSDALNTSRFAEEQSGVKIDVPPATLDRPHDYNPTMNLIKITGGLRSRFPDPVAAVASWRDGLGAFRKERRGYAAAQALADGPAAEGKFPRPVILKDRWQVRSATAAPAAADAGVSPVQAWAAAKSQRGLACHAVDKAVDLSTVLSG